MKNDPNTNTSNSKKLKITIIVIFALMLLLLAVLMLISEVLSGVERGNKIEVVTVDPSKLSETKEEGFDIFEYEEYLKYDRNIYLNDVRSGVKQSVDDNSYNQYGEAFELTYNLIKAIIRGDSDTYNSLIHEDVGHYDSFTQQQLYDIEISIESENLLNEDNNVYNEYVLVVEYKIHENNGSFRKDIESDASRPQYFVINGSTGELLVMDIIYVKYVK